MEYNELTRIIREKSPDESIKELKKGRGKLPLSIEEVNEQLTPSEHKVMKQAFRPDKLVKRDPDEDELTENTLSVTGEALPVTKKRIPVCRLPLGLQRLITERAVAFSFGNPVKVTADTDENTTEADVFAAIKSVLRWAKITSHDRQMARSVFTTTEVAELWYTQEETNKYYGFDSSFRLRCALFSPSKGDKLYPYFNEVGDMIAFSREFTIDDGNKSTLYFETWTAESYTKWKQDGDWVVVEGFPKVNPIGKIPVIYARQEETEWNSVQPLIERLETLLSNFGDTNDYHASPKLFLTGDIRGFAKKGESGAVIEGEPGATAQYISWQQAPESVKLEIETLLRMIHTITQTPDISFDSVKGMNVSGVSLKLMFMDAHLKVQSKSEIFDEYMQRRLSVIRAFLKKMNSKDAKFGEACDTITMYAELQPYMINDQASLINMLLLANGQKPIMSQKTAISELDWVADPDAELEQINKESAFAQLAELMRQQEPTNL